MLFFTDGEDVFSVSESNLRLFLKILKKIWNSKNFKEGDFSLNISKKNFNICFIPSFDEILLKKSNLEPDSYLFYQYEIMFATLKSNSEIDPYFIKLSALGKLASFCFNIYIIYLCTYRKGFFTD